MNVVGVELDQRCEGQVCSGHDEMIVGADRDGRIDHVLADTGVERLVARSASLLGQGGHRSFQLARAPTAKHDLPLPEPPRQGQSHPRRITDNDKALFCDAHGIPLLGIPMKSAQAI